MKEKMNADLVMTLNKTEQSVLLVALNFAKLISESKDADIEALARAVSKFLQQKPNDPLNAQKAELCEQLWEFM